MKDKPCEKCPMDEVSDKFCENCNKESAELISKGKFKQIIERAKNKQNDPEYSAWEQRRINDICSPFAKWQGPGF